MIRVGINGFGRIGKLVLRAALERDDIQVVAINDPFLAMDRIEYITKYDSVHGFYDAKFEVLGRNKFSIDDTQVYFSQEKKPIDISWGVRDVDVVIDVSGAYTKHEDAIKHIDDGGARKVIIGAPGKNMPMFVMGVNHNEYKNDMNVISNASCTTNCLAPIAKIINDEFGIEEGLMTTVHAQTASQKTVDGINLKNPRLGRSSQNIIPSTTGAAKAVGEVIPELKGKLTGMSFRVPTTNVSVVDLTLKLKKPTDYESIKKTIERYSKGSMKGIVGYTEDDVVSSDFIGDKRTSIFDSKAGIMLNSNFAKFVMWYDNEWGYTSKLLDLTSHISNSNK